MTAAGFAIGAVITSDPPTVQTQNNFDRSDHGQPPCAQPVPVTPPWSPEWKFFRQYLYLTLRNRSLLPKSF